MLWVALHFTSPIAPAALETIAAWTCQFTPRIALESPDALLAEVSGSLRYFGGAGALLARLERGMEELDMPAAIAVAATARAALWRARGGGVPFDVLPVSVLRRESDFFRSIGVATLGELRRLPREGLARRCGQALIDELDQALGRSPEPRQFFRPPERFDAALELPAEVAHAEALLFAARRLLLQLEGLLAARHAGIRSFTLHLAQRAASTELRIGLASPARSAERLGELLRERLASIELAAPVRALRLVADEFTALAGRSGGLFGDAAGEAEEWAALVERLQARLGRDAVFGISAIPDHRPEHAWQRVVPGDWDAREFTPPGPRPAWLLERAAPLEEKDVVLIAGPERIECGWWDSDEARRDYFIARLGDSLAWIYREEGAWFLHGFFA